MKTYDGDIYAWSTEQAQLLRTGRFDLLDVENIASEIEDVGKTERRELANRLIVLMAHLLKWQYQPERQEASWQRTIAVQRRDVADLLKGAPSLKPTLHEADWFQRVWDHAVIQAINDTGLDCFPDACPWSIDDHVLADGWLPA